jgi:two-component system OmpR family response regulator/two-component system phosphate regulon response regulator OmpR
MKEERPARILVVDDDFRLRELLRRYLSEQGLEVRVAADAEQMDRALAREHIDLIVLDLMLPGEDGLSVCRRLRGGVGRARTLPILMLTAKGDEIDRIVGLEMGADDYLPKPFNPRELLARIQAILRRQNSMPAGSPVEGDQISIGQWTLDTLTRTLKKGKEEVRLTTGEFALLSILATHPRQPMSRDQLMVDARGREMGPFDRAIDVQVSRLRKLIEPDPAKPRYLQTVWGVGYVFVPESKPVAD